MLNVLYTECLHYAVLFHSDDEMFLLLQNVLQWDVDSITLQKIAFLSAYYALPPIVQFNRLILSNEAFTLLHKSSFPSYLFSLFVFLATSPDAVHNPCVQTLLKEINSGFFFFSKQTRIRFPSKAIRTGIAKWSGMNRIRSRIGCLLSKLR